VDREQGDETWKYVKKRMKELNITGPDGPFYRTKCNCLRICTEGPIALVYPEGTWYRRVTPENAERIIQRHDGHPDMAEGSRAFLDKRKPRWAPYTGE